MYLMNAEGSEVGYWRKANAIHGWFIRELANGVDECQPIFVSRDNLATLRELCVKALSTKHVDMVTDEQLDRSTIIDEGQDMGKFLVERMQEETVIATLEKEFDDSTDPLRPVAGFFFGNTKKDQYYYDDIARTIGVIDEALSTKADSFIYQASW